MDERLLIARALKGDAASTRALLALLGPIVQARAAKILLRRCGNRSVRQEVFDFTQEIFASLFDDGGRALRAWVPERGLSLKNFVGLLAERQTLSLLRSRRTSPWCDDPEDIVALEPKLAPEPAFDAQLLSRDLLERVVDQLRLTCSPLAMQLFIHLFVDELTVDEIGDRMRMSADAVYAWRSRLSRRVREIVANESENASSERKPPSAGKLGAIHD